MEGDLRPEGHGATDDSLGGVPELAERLGVFEVGGGVLGASILAPCVIREVVEGRWVIVELLPVFVELLLLHTDYNQLVILKS